MGPEDSSWTINLEDMTAIICGSQGKQSEVLGASISPDSCYIALTTLAGNSTHLCLYSTSTGEGLGHVSKGGDVGHSFLQMDVTSGVLSVTIKQGCAKLAVEKLCLSI
jgi:hypothetical protein